MKVESPVPNHPAAFTASASCRYSSRTRPTSVTASSSTRQYATSGCDGSSFMVRCSTASSTLRRPRAPVPCAMARRAIPDSAAAVNSSATPSWRNSCWYWCQLVYLVDVRNAPFREFLVAVRGIEQARDDSFPVLADMALGAGDQRVVGVVPLAAEGTTLGVMRHGGFPVIPVASTVPRARFSGSCVGAAHRAVCGCPTPPWHRAAGGPGGFLRTTADENRFPFPRSRRSRLPEDRTARRRVRETAARF